MKTIHYLLLTGVLVLFSAFTVKNVVNWKVSDAYSVKFSGTKVEGIFKDLKGEVQFDESDLMNSKLSFIIAVNSINTGNGMKNKHAKSAKWFDAEQYPNITFKSEEIKKSNAGFEVTGDMTIHGITKKMTVPFTFENDVIKSSFSVKRLDFQVGTMKGMSKKVSDQINLDVTIPLSN